MMDRNRNMKTRYAGLRLMSVVVIIVVISLMQMQPSPVVAQGGEAATLFARLNQFRAQNGMGGLAWNNQLGAAATAHSQYLAANPWTHPHIEANGSAPQDRAAAQGYPGIVSENVVGGSTATVDWGWNWWLNSGVHRGNMLADWAEVGVGVSSGPYGQFYTMVFGRGGGVAAAPAAPAATTGSAASGGANTQAGQPAAAQPALPSRTPVPTLTPSITFTPSQTFTPRPTFTPSLTATAPPPTETALYLEVSPPPAQESRMANAGAQGSPTPIAIAAASTDVPAENETFSLAGAATDAPSDSGNGVRGLIPWLLVVQGVVLSGFVIRAAVRKRR